MVNREEKKKQTGRKIGEWRWAWGILLPGGGKLAGTQESIWDLNEISERTMRIAQRRALWVERLLKAKAMLHVREGNGTPLQSSCLENPMDGGAWWATVHGVAKSQTRLSDFTFTFCFLALEKEMATHSSVLAWRIPGTGEPSGLPSMGSHRVGHNWRDLAGAAACCMWILKTSLREPAELSRMKLGRKRKDYRGKAGFPIGSRVKHPPANAGDKGSAPGLGRRKEWQLTPVFLPEES